MPELPEVETVRLSLEPLIVGTRISELKALHASVLIDWTNENFPGLTAEGLQITAIRRRGKYLLFDLENDLMLVAHLRMTGQFKYQQPPQALVKHDHVAFRLVSADAVESIQLIFHDTRRFGRIWLLHRSQQDRIAGLKTLGPEPHDPLLTGAILHKRLQRRAQSNLKAVLLDQTVIAGLGNIYVDESLFLSQINPTRIAGSLTLAECDRLLNNIREILTRAVHAHGTSIKDYVDALNVRGTFQYQLQVYGRGNQACNVCGQALIKTQLAGRTTVYCPHCQPLKPLQSKSR
ncbi:MAG: bifunctional DNA-formamidopyrimidine glycosylase/DNA-(apurinic or apyrimidinic site) lyase [Eubacteriales bacterium]|nr:bifunctional DNA-formamidopyrimidine glycosylase/DNA-(apurinic or apyrimidinic site) lyase [Eubacteriales bacterium]